jgi:hypothetical protein
MGRVMRSSLATSLLFAALIAASLGGKLAARESVPKPNPLPFLQAAESALQEAGFSTEVRRSRLGLFLYGRAGECRIMVREMMEGATYAEGSRLTARAIGPTVYLYRGRILAEAPNALPFAEYYLWRGLHRIGIATARRPLAAIARSSGCGSRTVDWSSLAALPA